MSGWEVFTWVNRASRPAWSTFTWQYWHAWSRMDFKTNLYLRNATTSRPCLLSCLQNCWTDLPPAHEHSYRLGPMILVQRTPRACFLSPVIRLTWNNLGTIELLHCGCGHGCYPRTTHEKKNVSFDYMKNILLRKTQSSSRWRMAPRIRVSTWLSSSWLASRSARRLARQIMNGQTDCQPGLGYRLKFPGSDSKIKAKRFTQRCPQIARLASNGQYRSAFESWPPRYGPWKIMYN